MFDDDKELSDPIDRSPVRSGSRFCNDIHNRGQILYESYYRNSRYRQCIHVIHLVHASYQCLSSLYVVNLISLSPSPSGVGSHSPFHGHDAHLSHGSLRYNTAENPLILHCTVCGKRKSEPPYVKKRTDRSK